MILVRFSSTRCLANEVSRPFFIRPSRRIRIQTPTIDLLEYLPPPPDLVLVHEPRYAHRKSART